MLLRIYRLYLCVICVCFAVVHHQPPTLEVLITSAEDLTDQEKASLSCLATGFSPKDYKIKWQKGDEQDARIELNSTYDALFKEVKTENGTLYSVVSHLDMNKDDWTDGKPVTCVFEGANGNVTEKSVTYKKYGF